MFEKTVRINNEPEKLSALFAMLQDLSGDACVSSHVTGADLALKGLMWVVVRYEILMNRNLIHGESLNLRTWASPVRHRMSQRNYVAEDQDGNCVFSGSGVWAVADRKNRNMVDPDRYGVMLNTEVTGSELPRPVSPQKIPFQESRSYVVQADVLDINGHMNNTKYFDVIQTSALDLDPHAIKTIRAVFMNEAREGDCLTVRWGQTNGIWYFYGEKETNGCFQIGLECADPKI